MINQKQKLFSLVCLYILANIPVALCYAPPIIYVAGDGTGDFNCNGTNDQIEINQALQFVASNSEYTTVYLKGPFTYIINDTILIGNCTTLEGDPSAIIKLANNANWAVSQPMIKENNSDSHDITIQGFKINGNREGNNNVISGQSYYNLIHLSNCQNIDIHNMYLTDNHGDGLKTNSCSNIKFYNNEAYLLGHDVLYASAGSNVEAYNNKITCRTNSGLRIYNTNHVSFHDNIITSEGSGGAGIEIQKYGSPAMDDIEIYNNLIYETSLAGIWIFGSASYPISSANVHIHHNQIYDTGTKSSTKVIGGILSNGFNALIENNVIDGAYGSGIVQNNVYSPTPTGSGFVITVENNIITNTRTSTAGGNGYGIYNLLTSTHSFILQNNCFYNNAGGNFIGVQASPSDIAADPQYADRSKRDYHLKSKAGRWCESGWLNDSISSPCIDVGYSLSDYSNEPQPNGNRINIGPDGNTKYASKSEWNTPTRVLPSVNFSSNITSGYIPVSIQFIDTSQNTSSVWNWDFGDGTYSTQQNPMHKYSVVGNYIVKLTVSNANGTDSKNATINVLEKPTQVLPVANFSTNVTIGIAPLSIQFTDLSQNATSRLWDFGDSTNSTQQNPIHKYSTAGNYTVTLTVNNANGIDSKTNSINVIENSVPVLPIASLSSNITSGYAPLSVQFTDLSQNAISRIWDFGDGTYSTQQNPIHTYSMAGNYKVKLTASNSNGTDSKFATIAVLEKPVLPIANFSSNVTSGNVPMNVLFTDTSTGTPTLWNWSFGDSISSTQKDPIHVYSKAGSYTVTLTVSNVAGSNTVKKTSYITATTLKPPVAALSANLTSGTAPLPVLFNDKSTGGSPISWAWSFGDGTSSVEQNPVHTYNKAGKYTVVLKVSNAAGSNTITKSSHIAVNALKPPIAALSTNLTSGTAPLTVLFNDKSTGGSPTSWAWSFGDETYSTEKNPVHIYSKAGKYTVSLTVSNAAGSNKMTRSSYIAVNALKPPVTSFSASTTSGKIPLKVTFTDKSTGSPTAWSWNFGDGMSSIEKNPVHTYSKTGTYTVTLMTSNGAGSNTARKTSYISVKSK